MMLGRIQRWSPNTCNCVVEQVIEHDDQGNPISEVKFLLLNRVCDKHQPLASTQKKTNHEELSSNVLNLIEQAKTANLKQVDDQIAKSTRRLEKEDLIEARQQVVEFNARLDVEWGELVTFNHAFDSHIHDTIRTEQQR